MIRPELKGPPNETWADLKQLGWALLLVYPFIALTAYGARELLGVTTAIWFGLGLASGIVIPAGYALINGFSAVIVGFIGYGAINTIAPVATLSTARRARSLLPGTASRALPRSEHT